ncbi:GTP-sensing pleiotropic transcriptional regulator CodY [Clostridium sediminicola]|uniref:GTP-sensing pleiotropic transcriptional regulator CodY n=1 Tax=Clostridium sediminicola TaxID=3114879 RepID=UPI003D17869D
MNKKLLNKMRVLNKILHKAGPEPVVFEEICDALSHVLDSNVYIISKKAKILEYTFNKIECESVKQKDLKYKKLPEYFNNILLSIKETLFNIENQGKSYFNKIKPSEIEGELSTIIPIIGNRKRLGTLYLTRFEKEFDDSDLIIAEYTATIIGIEILKAENDKLKKEARKKAEVQLALGTLSYCELKAVEHVFNELNGTGGLFVAAKIADKVGIARSAIATALRKIESARAIEVKSLGVKGTYIKILNDKLLDELKRIKWR